MKLQSYFMHEVAPLRIPWNQLQIGGRGRAAHEIGLEHPPPSRRARHSPAFVPCEAMSELNGT